MSRSYRALSLGLRVVSVLLGVVGVFTIFSGKSLILRVSLHPPASEVSTLFMALLKEAGGLILMLGVMLFLAARNPARNVAIIDGLITGCCILAVTALLSLKDLHGLYPAYMIWGKALVRLALAAALFYTRPRETDLAWPQSNKS